MALAVERGEVDGRASWSWSSLKSLKPDWIAQKKVELPVQLNLARGPDLPDVPLIGDYAKTERQRQILKLVLSRQTWAGRSWRRPACRRIAPRRCARRSTTTMKDPEFVRPRRRRAARRSIR